MKPPARAHPTAVADYPSALTQILIRGAQSDFPVCLPENELFRVEAIFEKHEYAVPARFLPSESLTAVDIGANVGLFTLYLKSLRPDSTVYCFEPAPQTFALLQTNIKHLPDVYAHPFGLSDRSRTAAMALHPFNTGENSIKTTSPKSPACIDVAMVEAAKAFEDIGLDYIDILKIDTEGCEVDILSSLRARLAYVGVVMLEYHSEQDRRAIDRILVGFALFSAKTSGIGNGTMKYINRMLL